MPPKKKTDTTKADTALTPAKNDQPEPRTRTRGRQLNGSVDMGNQPTKRHKKAEDSDDEPLKKSKTQPKNGKNGDLSASKAKKDTTPAKDAKDTPAKDAPAKDAKVDKEPAKQPAKEPAKD